MDIHRYMQPAEGLSDTHIRNSDDGWVQTDQEGRAFIKVLWTNPQSGEWAVYYKWKKGFQAPAHKHLGAIHVYIISGRLRVRDMILEAGDYVYEANGMIHGETLALEDTVHLNIADGPLLMFDENNFTHYVGAEQMQDVQRHANPSVK